MFFSVVNVVEFNVKAVGLISFLRGCLLRKEDEGRREREGGRGKEGEGGRGKEEEVGRGKEDEGGRRNGGRRGTITLISDHEISYQT